MKNERETALKILYQVLEQGEYSHLVLARVLKEEAQAEFFEEELHKGDAHA